MTTQFHENGDDIIWYTYHKDYSALFDDAYFQFNKTFRNVLEVLPGRQPLVI